jgi:hypothetical protein
LVVEVVIEVVLRHVVCVCVCGVCGGVCGVVWRALCTACHLCCARPPTNTHTLTQRARHILAAAAVVAVAAATATTATVAAVVVVVVVAVGADQALLRACMSGAEGVAAHAHVAVHGRVAVPPPPSPVRAPPSAPASGSPRTWCRQPGRPGCQCQPQVSPSRSLGSRGARPGPHHRRHGRQPCPPAAHERVHGVSWATAACACGGETHAGACAAPCGAAHHEKKLETDWPPIRRMRMRWNACGGHMTRRSPPPRQHWLR